MTGRFHGPLSFFSHLLMRLDHAHRLAGVIFRVGVLGLGTGLLQQLVCILVRAISRLLKILLVELVTRQR